MTIAHHTPHQGAIPRHTPPHRRRRKHPNPTTLAHLDALVAKAPAGHGLVLSGYQPNRGRLRRLSDELVTLERVDQAAAMVAGLGDSWHVYVSTCALSPEAWADVLATGKPGARGGAAHVSAVTTVWADLDVAGPGHAANNLPPTLEAAASVLDTLPQPSYMVATGGGLHAYWRLTEALVVDDTTRADVAGLTTGWVKLVASLGAAKGWHVDQGVGDLARVLRLAGTYNPKTSPAPPVTMAAVGAWPPGLVDARPWQPGPTYHPDELRTIVANRVTRPAERAKRATELVAGVGQHKTKRKGDHRPTTGLGVLDSLEALPWSDVWPPGWEYVGTEGDAELWLRPGKVNPKDYEYSAKCWPGVAVVWSDSVPGLPGGGASYNRAAVMAWRLFGSPTERTRLAKAMAAQWRDARQRERRAEAVAR